MQVEIARERIDIEVDGGIRKEFSFDVSDTEAIKYESKEGITARFFLAYAKDLVSLSGISDGGFGCRTMYLVTVAWLTSMPSFNNSPWLRGSAPQRVLAAHSLDEFTYFLRGSRATRLSVARLPFPEKAEPPAVPADDRLGLDDDKGVLPAWPQVK